MWQTMKRHEAIVRAAMQGQSPDDQMAALATFHAKQIRFMQHERLVHLLVTLFVLLFLLLSMGFAATHPSWPALVLVVTLVGLSLAYLVHYFRLENGVQRWYDLSNRIDLRLRRAPDEGGRVDSGTSEGVGLTRG